MSDSWKVVKVGGGLFDLPDLKQRLCRFLDGFKAEKVLLVPGGGAATDVIRSLDRIHQLGEEASHWLAIRALSLNARFLMELLPGAALVSSLAGASVSRAAWHVLDPEPFFREDEGRSDPLPHSWDVTSDSLAARAAILLGAPELALLKSVSWDGMDWLAAAKAGIVDGFFPQASAALVVQLVNLRALS